MNADRDPIEPHAAELALAQHLHSYMAHQFPRLARGVVLITLMWWPLDYLIWTSPDTAQLTAWMRLAALGIAVPFVLTPFGRRLIESAPAATLISVSVVLSGIFGAGIGLLGVSSLPFLFIVPWVSIAFIVELRVRIMAAVTVTIVSWSSAYIAEPIVAHHPMWWSYTSFLIFLCLLAIMIGEAYYRMVRADFFQQAELRRQRAALQEMNKDLEGRVSEQTSQLRGLALRVQATRDSERRWVAKELREELSQQLTDLRRGLTLAQGRLDPNARSANRALDDCGEIVDKTTHIVRSIMEKLRPDVDAELGLADSLKWLAEDLNRRTGVRCAWEDGLRDEPLPPSVVDAAYKVTREGLNNIAQHARARNATVRARQEGNDLVLRIEDDGLGAPIDAHTRPTGGLADLRKMLRELDGHLVIDQSSLGGTKLEVSFPLAERPAETGSPSRVPKAS